MRNVSIDSVVRNVLGAEIEPSSELATSMEHGAVAGLCAATNIGDR